MPTAFCCHSETSGRRPWVSISGPQPTLDTVSFLLGFHQRRAQPLQDLAFPVKGAPTRSNMIESSLAPLRVAAWFAVSLTRPVVRSQCPEPSANLPLLVYVGLCPCATLEVSARAVDWLHLKTPWGVLKIPFQATIRTGMATRQGIRGNNRI